MDQNIQFLRTYFDAGPSLDCKGCYSCCTITKLTQQELEAMLKLLKKKGYTEPPMGKGPEYCEFLDTEGQCAVYEERPITCRAHGKLDTEDTYCDINANLDKSTIPVVPELEEYYDNNKIIFNGTVKRLLAALDKK